MLGTTTAAHAAAPTNDSYAGATVLTGPAVFNESELTAGATAQAGEPAHAGHAAAASIWYRWTAPADVVVDAHSALTQLGPSIDQFPHALAFYTGSRVSSLTPVASAFGTEPTVKFRASAGTVYNIALNVPRTLAPLGNTHLFLDTRPGNDDLADASTVAGASGTASGYTGSATIEAGDEPAHSLLDGYGGSVWYKWTAPSNGFTRFGVECCASFGTQPVMAVYTGSSIAALSAVSSSYGCSVGAFNTCTSFQHVKGTTYHIAVQGDGGEFPLKWAPVASGCTVTGTAGADLLTGTARTDLICGLGGNDTIKGLGGDDVIVGGPGTDTVDYANAALGVTADLRRAAAFGEGLDSLQQVENITGSRFSDKLDGDPGANVLSGGAGSDGVWGQGGNDDLEGGSGADTVGPGAGNDTADGGSGKDTAHFGASASGVTVDLGAGTATGEGADTLSAFEDAYGSEHADVLIGSELANELLGFTGNDTLRGLGGNDRLYGMFGNDRLDAGSGTDTCNGGDGQDTGVSCEASAL